MYTSSFYVVHDCSSYLYSACICAHSLKQNLSNDVQVIYWICTCTIYVLYRTLEYRMIAY